MKITKITPQSLQALGQKDTADLTSNDWTVIFAVLGERPQELNDLQQLAAHANFGRIISKAEDLEGLATSVERELGKSELAPETRFDLNPPKGGEDKTEQAAPAPVTDFFDDDEQAGFGDRPRRIIWRRLLVLVGVGMVILAILYFAFTGGDSDGDNQPARNRTTEVRPQPKNSAPSGPKGEETIAPDFSELDGLLDEAEQDLKKMDDLMDQAEQDLQQ